MKFRQAFAGAAAATALMLAACQSQRPNIAPSPTTEGDDIVGTVAGPKGASRFRICRG